jgi:DNA-binding SARP family transcriptional activator
MLVLRLFGSLDLRGPDDLVLRAVLRQPKRSALLVYLATAGSSTFHRRDTLLGLFWPEVDERRARDALNTSLRFLRRSLGPAVLLSRGDEEVGLDTTRIWSDVRAFEQALTVGNYEGALALYRGDLLSGFHAVEAKGFEEWLELARGRYRTAAGEAARLLAGKAVALGNQALGEQWYRRGLGIEPYDERTVRGLMELFAAMGDHAGALRTYQDFVARLARELEIGPSPETESIAQGIRTRTRPVPQPLIPASETARAEPAAPAARAPRRRRWRRPAAAGIASLAIVATLLTSEAREPANPTSYTILADVAGSAPAETRRVMKSVLTVTLDRLTGLRPVSGSELREGLARMLRADSLPLDQETARELAYRGALRTVVAPYLDHLGGRFVLTVLVIDAETGKTLMATRAEARTEDGLVTAADRATQDLQRRFGDASENLRAVRPPLPATTASFEAYRKFAFSGPSAVRVERLREALAIDTGFAAAWEALARYWSNVGGRDSMLAAAGHLEQNLAGLSERERLEYQVTIAMARRDYPGALAVVDRLIAEYDSVPGLLNTRGRLLSIMGRWEEAVQATRAALTASRFGPVRRYVVDLRQWLIMAGRPAEARAVEDSLRAAACRPDCPSWPSGITERTLFAILLDEWEQADSLFRFHGGIDPLIKASLHGRRGELRAAERALDSGGPGEGLHPELARLMLALMRPPPWRAPSGLAQHDQLHARAWTGIWNALSGDTVAAAGIAAALVDSVPGPYRGAAPELIRGLIAARAGRWRDAIEVLTPVAMTNELGTGQNDVWVSPLPLRWLAAQGYEQLNLPDSAVVMYERFLMPGGSFLQPLALRGISYSFAHHRLAVNYSKLGRLDEAQRHWQTFRGSFTNPDPEFHYLIDEADSALGRRGFSWSAPTSRPSPNGPLRF